MQKKINNLKFANFVEGSSYFILFLIIESQSDTIALI